MKTLNINNSFYPHKQKRLKLYFFSLFFIFSSLVLGLSYTVSQYLITNTNKEKLQANLEIEFNSKKDLIENFTNSQKHYLFAITSHQLVSQYFSTPKEHELELTNYLLSLAKTSPTIMQLRLLDNNGYEKIKIVRNSEKDQPLPLNKTQLQNKSHRYYYQKALELKPNQLWFSQIDLNIEHGEIEIPVVPTIRVLCPIFTDDEFQGVIILNLFIEKILEQITNSLHFDIAILDSNSEYIQHHYNSKQNWSAYFQERISFFEEFYIYENKMLNKKTKKEVLFFTKEIKKLIPNNKISLLFIPKQHTFDQIQSLQREYTLYLIVLIFFISIPISILLARFPFNYTKDLLESKHRLLELVNENVLYSSSDIDGIIIDVSEALCKLTNYSKEELVGENHSIFRHPDTPDTIFQTMWSTILKGHIWSGEIQNIDKDYNSFWINVTITPNFEDTEIVGFTAIRENITDKKIIEALSITDELTTLYNKRFFNKTFPREIKRAKRLKTHFVFVILDIDNFKLYNDTYGHKEGDSVLQEIGVLIRKMFKRSYDFPFRIGGEEFAIIFTEKDTAKIYPHVEALRKAIEELHIEHQFNANHGIVTTSIGYKVMNSDKILTETEIYQQADKALYLAKKSGRNTVINYDEIKL